MRDAWLWPTPRSRTNARMSTAPSGDAGKEGLAAGAGAPAAGAPAAEQKPAVNVEAEALAAKYAALEAEAAAAKKAAKKAEQNATDLAAKMASPEFLKEIVAKALGTTVDVDPKAERDAAMAARTKAEATANAATLKLAATTAALAAGVKPDRLARALRNVDLSVIKLSADGEIENLADFTAELNTLKTELPDVFAAAPVAAAPAEKPGPQVPRTPQTGQPASKGAGPLFTEDTARTLPIDELRKLREQRRAARLTAS